MNEVTVQLVPAPGAPPEFLATITPLVDTEAEDLPFEITLGKYSREKWAESPPPENRASWKETWFRSVDGRRKLPGFLKYLRERRKAAFGTFEATASEERTRGVFVIPSDQPAPPSDTDADDALVFARYACDERSVVPNKRAVAAPPKPPAKEAPLPPPPVVVDKPIVTKTKSGASGLLGDLLGKQRRTNAMLAAAPKSAARKLTTKKATGDGENDENGGNAVERFRQSVERTLRTFAENADAVSTRITVTVGDEGDENATPDVLQFVVNELVEEIGEDRWVTAKERTEFVDEESVVVVYKEGHAPPEVMEELTKCDVPDEIVNQTRAFREASAKQSAAKARKLELAREQEAVRKGSRQEVTQLNVNKRDRRTIAEIQNDMNESKKQRNE